MTPETWAPRPPAEKPTPEGRWYCLHTKPRMENQVNTILTSKGFVTYLPLIGIQHKRHGHPLLLVEPLFPSYLFAQLDLDTVGISAVRWTPGLHDFVQCAGRPAIVSPDIVDSIRVNLASGETQRRLAQPPFRSGEPVRVKEGPLSDLSAIFERSLPGKLRAGILVQLLGRQMSVELDIELLERVSR